VLFAAPAGSPFTLELDGAVLKPAVDSLQVKVTTVHAWPMGQHQTKLNRPVLLSVPTSTVVQSAGPTRSPVALVSAKKGQSVKVWTMPSTASLRTERGDDRALNAALVLLQPPR
jgi:hypothetical protein